MKKYILFFIIIIFLASISFKINATEPTVYISFDKGFDGEAKFGVVKANRVLFPKLVNGRFGKAMKAGPLDGYVEYLSNGILNASEGTIEMWVKPDGWAANDGKFHVFFEARNEGALYLYKYYDSPRLLMLSAENSESGPYYNSSSNIDWVDDEWHHIAGSWSISGLNLYIDGKPVSNQSAYGVLPKTISEYFKIGDLPWGSVRVSSTIIDEVRLYDRALGHKEVAAHFAGNFDSSKLLQDKFNINHSIDIDKNILNLIINHRDIRNNSNYVNIEVRNDKDISIFGLKNVFLGKEKDNIAIPLAEFKPGKYKISVYIPDSYGHSNEVRDEFNVPDLSWKYKAGDYVPQVPYPWTPIESKNDVVNIWGRKYVFDKSLFPTSMVSMNKQLLSNPIGVNIRNGNENIPFITRNINRKISDTGAYIEMNGILHVPDSLSNFPELKVSTKVEYDGMMLFTISGDVRSNVNNLQSLSIDIPLNPEFVHYRHKLSTEEKGVSGAIPWAISIIDSTSFIPFYWLGDDTTGIFWFAETGRMWPNFNNNDAIQVIKNFDSITIRLNIKKEGQVFPPNWVYQFGLQATPVKPLPEKWRKKRIAPAYGANMDIIWPETSDKSFLYYGYPEARNEKAFRKNIELIKNRGMLPIPYICATFLSTQAPEWEYFNKKWSMGIYDSSSSDVRAYGGSFAMVSPSGDGWNKFITSKIRRFADKFDINDGIYLDNSQLYGAYAPDAGLGFYRNGKRYKEYPILAYRALYKEIYEGFKLNNPNSFLIAHMSGNINIPVLAFVDAYLNGEQYRGVVKDNYLDVMHLDTFRTEFIGRQWGLVPIFLPEFQADAAKSIYPTKAMMALLLQHDVTIWPIWSNVEEVNKALKILDSYGYENAEFVPYYSSKPIAISNKNNMHVSGYIGKSGNDLLIISNILNRAKDDTICLINKESISRIYEVEETRKKDIQINSKGCFEVDIDAGNYMFISIERVSTH
jgi:hypothetical protein